MSGIKNEVVKLCEKLQIPVYLSFVDGTTGVIFVIYFFSDFYKIVLNYICISTLKILMRQD